MTSNEVKLPKSWRVSSRFSPWIVFWIFTLFSFFRLHVDDDLLVQETENIHAERWTLVRKLCGGKGITNLKLSRVMRRGHFSKITVSYRFKPKIPRSPPPPPQAISNDWSHRPSEPCDNVSSPSLTAPSPIVHELVRARSAVTVANRGNAQKNSPDS